MQTALKAHATSLFSQVLDRHEEKVDALASRSASSDERWLKTILKGGTLTDRLAAMSLTVSADPLHSYRLLRQLINLSNRPARRDAMMACEAACDLFTGDNVLPGDRRLRFFHENLQAYRLETPEGAIPEKLLVEWAYEELLKDAYSEFLRGIEKLTHDTVEHTKTTVSSVT